MDITKVRPVIRNLRARAIDGKHQLVFWNKPVGGRLLGYSIRLRVNGVQGDWCDVPNKRVHWGYTYHAVVVRVPDVDPAEVVVTVRAVNEYRHSSPAPETHLATDYRVVLGDSRHSEPRLDRSPNRPHVFMSKEDDDMNLDENLLDWATEPAEYLFWNRTQEELALFCGHGKLRKTHRFNPIKLSADGQFRDLALNSNPVDARLEQFDCIPDMFILVTAKRSSYSFSFPSLEHSTDVVPAWAVDLREIGESPGFGKIRERLFHPFNYEAPGCWAIATRFTAAHRTKDSGWLTGYERYVLQAADECRDGSLVGGRVHRDLEGGCYLNDNGELVVHLESDTRAYVESWTIRDQRQPA